MSLSEELIALEHEGWEALVAGRGSEYYSQKLTAGAVMAFPFGVLTREKTIEAMRAAPPWASFELIDPQVVELTDDAGIVVYRVRAQRAGEQPYEAVISSTFVREDGDWKLAFHQQSPPA